MSYMGKLGNCKTSSQSTCSPMEGGVQLVIRQDPVVQVEEDEGQRIDDYGDGVQHTGLLHYQLQSNPDWMFDSLGLLFLRPSQFVIVSRPRLRSECQDGQYDGVLYNCTEDTADAGHDESLDSIQVARARGGGSVFDCIEGVDDDEEEDHQERHSARNDCGVDDEGDPADGDEEDAGTVDLVQEDLVLSRQLNLKAAGSVAT